MVYYGVLCGMVYGMIWCSMVCLVQYIWCGMMWYTMVCYVIWYGMCGTVWYVWYNMAC